MSIHFKNGVKKAQTEIQNKLDKHGVKLGNAEKEKPFEAHGVKGMKSTPWRKTFKSQAEFEKWLDKNGGDVEVYGTRDL